MTLAFLLELLPMVLKLVVYFIDSTKNTPDEERRKILANFDAAIDKAKAGDPGDLSKWLGKNL